MIDYQSFGEENSPLLNLGGLPASEGLATKAFVPTRASISKDMESRTRKMMSNEVNEPDPMAPGFTPNPTVPSNPATGEYSDNTGYYRQAGIVESNNDYNAYNKSGATGKYQFFESTAKPYLDKMGKTWDEYKTTPSIQEEVMRAHTDVNRKVLIRNGYEPTNLNLYRLHQQGAGGGIQMLKGEEANSMNLLSNNVSNNAEWDARYGPKFN